MSQSDREDDTEREDYTDAESDTEVTFRHPEGSDGMQRRPERESRSPQHQPSQEHAARGSSSTDRAGPSADRETPTNWMRESFDRMMEMQGQMSSALQDVASVLQAMSNPDERRNDSNTGRSTLDRNRNCESTQRNQMGRESSSRNQQLHTPSSDERARPIVRAASLTSQRQPSSSNRRAVYSEADQLASSPYHEPSSPTYDNVERNRYWNELEQGDYARTSDHNRPTSRHNPSIKIPPFFGKEDWKVWFLRFEMVAERQFWSQNDKLDQLLPRLQGLAGEFVFTQLPKETLRCYDRLVQEISNRFRVVETPKSFAAKFSRRDQRTSETAEEYAAELKRLYDRAHRGRDQRTRREDLVRRFLDGLRDEEVRCEVEYVKDPRDIDEAVFEVVNFVQTKRRKVHHHPSERKASRSVRSANEWSEDEEEVDRVDRIPQKKMSTPEVSKNKATDHVSTSQERECDPSQSPEAITLLKQLYDKMSELVEVKESKYIAKPRQESQRRDRKCYACNEVGHFARDCRNRQDSRMNNSSQDTGQYRDRFFFEWRKFPSRCIIYSTGRVSFKRERTDSDGRDAVLPHLNGHGNQESRCPGDVIRRRRPYCDGVYLEGTIEEVPIVFTTDTGATKTVISERVYNRISPEKRPALTKTKSLTGAGGVPLKELGKARFNLQLGPVEVQEEVVVADIEDEGLLGIDVPQNGEDGPADILLSRGVIRLKGQDIPCVQVGLMKPLKRVIATNDVLIPGHSRTEVDVLIERKEEDDYRQRARSLVEPTEDFRSTCLSQMASVMVDINDEITSEDRLTDPCSEELSTKRRSVIRQAGCIEAVDSKIKCHGCKERNSDRSVRRVHSTHTGKERVTQKPAIRTDVFEKRGYGHHGMLHLPCSRVIDEHFEKPVRRNNDLHDPRATMNRCTTGDIAWFLPEARKEGVSPRLGKMLRSKAASSDRM